MLRGADFTTEEFYRDPSATVARLRALGPLVEVKLPIVGTVWMTTTQEVAGARPQGQRHLHAAQGRRRHRRRSVVDARHLRHARQQHADLRRARPHAPARYRRRGLSPPRRSRHGAARARPLPTSSPMSCSPTAARPMWSSAMRGRLPLSVICELLGLPLADRQKFMDWAGNATNVTSAFRASCAWSPASSRSSAISRERLDAAREERRRRGSSPSSSASRRKAPDQPRRDGLDRVSVALCRHETTTHLISGSVYELLRRSRLVRDWLMAGPAPRRASRSRNSCASFRRCSSPSRASCARTSSSTA